MVCQNICMCMHIHNRVLLVLKRMEILSHATIWKDRLKDIMRSASSQSQKTNAVWFHSCEVSGVIKFIGPEIKTVLARS